MAPKQLEPMDVAAMSMSRSMGPSEENWARMVDQGTGITATAIALTRHVKEEEIRIAMKGLMEHYPLTRAQIVESIKGKLHIIVKDEAVEPLVTQKAWPKLDPSLNQFGLLPLDLHDNGEENQSLSLALYQIMSEQLNIPFLNEDKLAAPPVGVFEAHYYKNTSPAQAQTVIVIRIHSGSCDRHSCIKIVDQFVGALNACVEGKSPEFPECPQKQEQQLLAPMEDLIPKSKADKGFFTKGLNIIGYALDSKKYSLLPFHPDFTKISVKAGLLSDFLAYSLGTQGTGAFFSACERESTTPAAALASAYLRTAANMEEMKEKKLNQFCFTGVLDCRPHFEPPLADSVLGNYSAGIFQGAKVKDDISFWDLARLISNKTTKEIEKNKHFSELPVLAMLVSQVIKRPNLTPSNSKRSGLFTYFLGEAANTEWRNGQSESLNVAGSIGPLASMHGIGPCFSSCEYIRQAKDGPELCIFLTFASPVYTRHQMHSFATSALDLLTSECSECK